MPSIFSFPILYFCFQYNTSIDDVRAMFEPYGDIQNVFSLIDGRGMTFITYVSVPLGLQPCNVG